MKNKQYKKLMIRSFPLIFLNCWYEGERFGLRRITNKKMYFEPLFIYNKNKGTDVYYNVSDKKQDPNLLVGYFNNHFYEFKKLVKNYKKNYKIFSDISKSIFDVYSLSKEMFPVLTSMVVIGNNSDEKKNKNILKLSNETREKTEDFILIAIKALLKEAKIILPNKYHKYLYFISFEEIINKKFNLAILKSRSNGYIFYQGKIYDNKNIGKFLKTNNIDIVKDKIEKKLDDLMIKGNTAYGGKIKGRVRKVFEVSDMNKVKKGNVLVTSMTTPDLIAINKNFSAIVTDEGGVTCHAAIISRELKIPCVIGTKIATKVLKDGDLVEVDAERGMVRILKRVK